MIGEDYKPLTELNALTTINEVIFGMSDKDGDKCVSKDEMWSLMQWGQQDMSVYSAMAAEMFDPCDANGSGILSWAELDTCFESQDKPEG